MKSFINIKAESEEEGLLEIFGQIGYDFWTGEGTTAESITDQLDKLGKCKKVKCRINSLGGNVNDALAIYDILRGCEDVETECIGMCASAATIIFMAGKKRQCSKNALFLIHKCISTVQGNENDLEAELEAQRTVNERIMSIYEDNGCKRKDVEDLMCANSGDGKWIDAKKCKDLGFATDVLEDGCKRKNELVSEFFDVADFEMAQIPVPSFDDEKLSLATRFFRMLKDELSRKEGLENVTKLYSALECEVLQDKEGMCHILEADLTAIDNKIAALCIENENLVNEIKEKADEYGHAVIELNEEIANLKAIINNFPTANTAVNGLDNKDNNGKDFADFARNTSYYDEVNRITGKN